MKSAVELLENLNVAIYQDLNIDYPSEAPFSPAFRYPEYPFQHVNKTVNSVYDAFRKVLLLLGLDKENFGTDCWNPLKEIIRPGDTVVIKPNFVLDRHDEGGDLFAIITHPSVIRAVIDYVYLALNGEGRIIITDAPQMDCNFSRLLENTNLLSIRDLYKRELGFEIEIYDLRNFWFDVESAGSARVAYSRYRYNLPGDPCGQVTVSLGKESLFYGMDPKNFYGADYDRREIMRFHHGEVQEYVVSKTILSADVVILIPKLKTHKKVGVTLNIKGLVGMVTNKNCLVHYRLGPPSAGGDQFPDNLFEPKEAVWVKLQRLAFDWFLSHRHPIADAMYDWVRKMGVFFKPLGFGPKGDKHLLDAGNWYGNDSAWRMAVDLYRVFLYADSEGSLSSAPVRRVFSVIDGVIGGEGKGPLTPASKKCGLLIAGFNPSAVDIVATRLMGFDYKKLKMFSYILLYPELFKVKPQEIAISSNRNEYINLLEENNAQKCLDFTPPPGWRGFVEV
ncbi:MAG: DUF362 domain-containing protein [Candidatus Bathyarchaeia archaeon]